MNMTSTVRLTHLSLFLPVSHIVIVPDNATTDKNSGNPMQVVNGVLEKRKVGVK